MPTQIEVRFVSSNEHKIAEAERILGGRGIRVLKTPLKIDELQTTDTKKLVHDKALKAYHEIGRPLFIEHTGLYLAHLNGLPGGLTQIFWDTLRADRFAELFGELAPNTKAVAKTAITFCDGKGLHDFEGQIDGNIVPRPRGSQEFQWDCVFQPQGEDETFAEMGDRKNQISMRRLALDRLAEHLANKVR